MLTERENYLAEENRLLMEWWAYLEKVWGVVITVRLQMHTLATGERLNCIHCTCPYQVHVDELNGYEGVWYPYNNSPDLPYAYQARLALQFWEKTLIERMAH